MKKIHIFLTKDNEEKAYGIKFEQVKNIGPKNTGFNFLGKTINKQIGIKNAEIKLRYININ